MGKSTISMAIFNSYVTNYQRVMSRSNHKIPRKFNIHSSFTAPTDLCLKQRRHCVKKYINHFTQPYKASPKVQVPQKWPDFTKSLGGICQGRHLQGGRHNHVLRLLETEPVAGDLESPSGKHTKNYGKIHHVSWENSL